VAGAGEREVAAVALPAVAAAALELAAPISKPSPQNWIQKTALSAVVATNGLLRVFEGVESALSELPGLLLPPAAVVRPLGLLLPPAAVVRPLELLPPLAAVRPLELLLLLAAVVRPLELLLPPAVDVRPLGLLLTERIARVLLVVPLLVVPLRRASICFQLS
jgi:hypothetical protein